MKEKLNPLAGEYRRINNKPKQLQSIQYFTNLTQYEYFVFF